MRMRNQTCWQCKYGIFHRYKRGEHLVRSYTEPAHERQGHCFLKVGRPFPTNWEPPKQFWSDVESGIFQKDFHEFVHLNAYKYWGEEILVEYELESGMHFDMEDARKQHKWMCWIARNLENLASITATHSCPSFTLRE